MRQAFRAAGLVIQSEQVFQRSARIRLNDGTFRTPEQREERMKQVSMHRHGTPEEGDSGRPSRHYR
jgi:hypothetical protein